MTATLDSKSHTALLHAAVVAHARAANSADAARIDALDSYYDARMLADAGSIPTHSCVVAEAAAATHTTDTVVGGLLTLWWTMLPRVKAAFRAGDISLATARVIKNHTAGARTSTLRDIEDDILSAATVLAPGPLGTEIDRLLTAADPEWDTESRKRAAITETTVRITKQAHGLLRVVAVVPAVDGAAIAGRLDEETRRVCTTDPTTINHTRSRAFVAAFRGERLFCGCGQPDCRNPAPSSAFAAAADGTVAVIGSGAAPAVVTRITCDLELILGIGSAGAQMHGFGTIDAATARTLAADSTWQAIFLASRRFLDTLTGGEPYYGEDTGDDPPSTRTRPASCACRCGGSGCAVHASTEDRQRLDEVIHRATDRDNADAHLHAGYVDDTVALGRGRLRAAGVVPEPRRTGGLEPDRPSVGEIVEHWTRRFADGYTPPPNDGHGGFRSPPPGALTYTPTAALAALVRAHHSACIHPGCTVPSDRCDLDHTVEFDKKNPLRGGWTILANLGPLCRRHHNLKTDKLWRYSRLPDGTFLVVDPLGNLYFTVPDRIG